MVLLIIEFFVFFPFSIFCFKSKLDSGIEVSNNYWKTELQCRKFTELISYWFIISNQAVYLATLIYSIYSICVGNTDPSTWSLPFLVAFPTNTPWRWYLALFFETNIGFAYSLAMVATTSFFVCGCLYICAICDHCCFLIKSIDADNEYIILGRENPAQLIQIITEKSIESIKMHVRAHEWVFNSVSIFEIVYSINMFWIIIRIFDQLAGAYDGAIFFLLPTSAIFMALAAFNSEHVITVLIEEN